MLTMSPFLKIILNKELQMYSNYIQEMDPYQYGAIPQLNPIGATSLSTQYGPDRIDPARPVGLNTVLKGVADAATSMNPLLKAGLGFIGNIAGKAIDMGMQTSNQKSLMAYQKSLNSPQQMMADMKAAGINPNAAAQGIAGAPGAGAAGLGSAAMSQGTPGLIDTLANSENTRLNADYIKAMTNETNASAELKESQNVGQMQENAWYETKQQVWLQGALSDNRIKKSTANMLEQDEFYHGAEAEQHFYQTMLQTNQMVQTVRNMEQEFINKCAEYQLIMAQIGLTSAQQAEVWSQVGVNNAMVGKINAETRNIDMTTMIKGEEYTQSQITTELMKIKQGYETQFYNDFLNTGWYTGSTTNQNAIRMTLEGKTDDAKEVLSAAYDFAKGQYGAKGEQARAWINTAVGGLATVAGAIMMFCPGLQVPGAVVGSYGVHKMAKSLAGGTNANNGYGRYDGSWNTME